MIVLFKDNARRPTASLMPDDVRQCVLHCLENEIRDEVRQHGQTGLEMRRTVANATSFAWLQQLHERRTGLVRTASQMTASRLEMRRVAHALQVLHETLTVLMRNLGTPERTQQHAFLVMWLLRRNFALATGDELAFPREDEDAVTDIMGGRAWRTTALRLGPVDSLGRAKKLLWAEPAPARAACVRADMTKAQDNSIKRSFKAAECAILKLIDMDCVNEAAAAPQCLRQRLPPRVTASLAAIADAEHGRNLMLQTFYPDDIARLQSDVGELQAAFEGLAVGGYRVGAPWGRRAPG